MAHAYSGYRVSRMGLAKVWPCRLVQDIGLFRPRAILEQHPTLKTWVAAAEVVPWWNVL